MLPSTCPTSGFARSSINCFTARTIDPEDIAKEHKYQRAAFTIGRLDEELANGLPHCRVSFSYL